METVEVGGLNIAYERVGSGPALVSRDAAPFSPVAGKLLSAQG